MNDSDSAANDSTPVAPTNADQSSAWNGPEGANWATHSTRRVDDGDLVGPLLAAAAIEPTERVLDVGCGTGELTRLAAREAHRGTALGIDLAAQMIDVAREIAAATGPANAAFEIGDVQVYPFETSTFDVAVSHFGTMFFSDPVAAFTNIASAVARRGRLVFVCPQSMDRCDWYTVPLTALLGRAPDEDVAPSAMFSLADPGTLRRVLAAAGFVHVALTAVEQSLWFGDDVATACEMYLGSGPAQAIVARRPELTEGQARERLESALAPFLTSAGVRLSGNYWLVESSLEP